MQGGPHQNTIAGVATALREVMTPTFKRYATQTVLNCKKLASELLAKGYSLVSGGTDNHLILLDLSNLVRTFSYPQAALLSFLFFRRKSMVLVLKEC